MTLSCSKEGLQVAQSTVDSLLNAGYDSTKAVKVHQPKPYLSGMQLRMLFCIWRLTNAVFLHLESLSSSTFRFLESPDDLCSQWISRHLFRSWSVLAKDVEAGPIIILARFLEILILLLFDSTESEAVYFYPFLFPQVLAPFCTRQRVYSVVKL